MNSLTATSFLQTSLLQSAAADLQIQNATATIRAEDGTLLASFAAGSIGLEQNICPVGPDAQRHGGFRPVLRGLHGGHRGLHEQQLHHRYAANRERSAGPGAAAALRSGGQRADRHDRTEHRRQQQRGADLRLRLRERDRMTLDYQKLNVVLWSVVKSLQKRVEKLEKKKQGRSN